MSVNWHGVYPALTTQFRDDESIDMAATAVHLEKMIASGIHGVILLGSVGENTALSYEEKMLVLREMMPVVKGRVPVLSGVAENTTRTACSYARDCEKIGIDGLMVLPAMIYKADRLEAMAHFRAVARASGLPIMIYNNPPSYYVDLSPESLKELADEPTLVAVKESCGDPRRITDVVNALGDRYIVFSGVDDLVLESAMLGAKGWVSGLVNAFPDENRVLWEHCVEGRWSDALELYRWYTPLLHLDTHIKLVQYIKMCMAAVGMGSEKTRAPRLRVEGAEREKVIAVIEKALRTRPQL